MKTFRRIQAIAATAAMWVAIAVSNNSEATGNEIFVSATLAFLAGMVIVSVLLERAKEEMK